MATHPGTTGPDAALSGAEQEIHSLLSRLKALRYAGASEEEITPVLNRILALDFRIATTAPATLSGAMIKLRRLLDPDLGMEISQKDSDVPCLRQILALIEARS